MNFGWLIRNDFEIRDGRFYERNGSYTGFDIREEAWSTRSYIIVGDYSASGYRIATEVWNDNWYLYNGHSPVRRLYYHGGENWTSY